MAELRPNADRILSGRMQVVAAGRPYHLPDIQVPDEMAIVVKAAPGNGGLIYAGGSGPDVRSIETSYPLLPNEAAGYYVKNAAVVWFSGTVAGDFIHYTVEQMRRG